MKEFADLISAVTFLLLVAAVVLFIIRPPEALRKLFAALGEAGSGLRKLRVGNVEAELAPDSSAPSPPTSSPTAELVAPPSERVESQPPATTADATTASATEQDLFWRAVGLAHDGNYQQALAEVREAGAPSEKTKRWRLAFIQQIAADQGSTRAFLDLQQTLTEDPTNADVRQLVATAFAERGEASRAEELLREGITIASSGEDQIKLIIAITALFRTAKRHDEAIKMLRTALGVPTELHLRSKLLVALAETYRYSTPPDLAAAFCAYELALQSEPGDTETRFALAYAYSEADQNAMAFHHYYNELLTRQPLNTTARNNAGVSARELKLPMMATRLQRQASESGNTLASSNLAFELIRIGFIDEARQVLQGAKANANPHARIALAEAEITTATSTEEQHLQIIERNSQTMSAWRQRIGRAFLEDLESPEAASGNYRGVSLSLELRITTNGMADGLLIVGNSPTRVTITGRLRGRVILYTWKTERPTDGSYYWPEDGHGVLLVSGNTIVGYRQKGASQDSFNLGTLVEFEGTRTEQNQVGA
jgi:tetratricopeptide (TPR) repeat protein